MASDIITANPDVNIIYAANEGGTVGAVQAVRKAGKQGSIYVFGIDGTDQLAGYLLDDDNVLQSVTASVPQSATMSVTASVPQSVTMSVSTSVLQSVTTSVPQSAAMSVTASVPQSVTMLVTMPPMHTWQNIHVLRA